jgi:hypothetical protein
MTYMIEVLRQEHCNIERLLRILERELSVFERGDRPDYEVKGAVWPSYCPNEDTIAALTTKTTPSI